MKLKPHEILQKLGFNVGEEGITINEHDALLIDSTLRLAGSTIDLDRLSEKDLFPVHEGLAGLAASWNNEQPLASDPERLAMLRTTLKLTLKLQLMKQQF